jgi:cell fate regulator YaaT (PSP1 superfamily)
METAAAPRIVGIRFQELGKLYHFDASSIPDLQVGDQVLVSTSRGREMGEVAGFVDHPPAPPEGSWKAVERRATAQELVGRRLWQRRELEAMIECRAKASELGMRHVKIAKAEFSYDGARLTFLFSGEGEERVDVRDLRREMTRLYHPAEIDFRQVGPRDVARILGGMGACGLEERCCSKFLTEFSPVSIKMAKAQGISLNPQEITGMCGRLRCCLVYEYEQYVEARKTMPKRNKRVITPAGEGRVTEVLALKQAVIVALDDGKRAEFYLHELQPYDELKALQAKAMAPCGKHEAGHCTCGRNGAPDEDE